MENKLREIYLELESSSDPKPNERVIKNLGLEKEVGLRLSYVYTDCLLEFLIEVPEETRTSEFDFPLWQGMNFSLIEFDFPTMGSKHVRLQLESEQSKDVFFVVCADLAERLGHVTSLADRKNIFKAFLERWTHFFSKATNVGLPKTAQQGLYGELNWLKFIIQKDVERGAALNAWKGCERNYHDFEVSGEVVEVKTTKSKAPRKVWISNERQLDDTGLNSLHLLVLTLVVSERGGQTLPELVAEISAELGREPSLQSVFKEKLQRAGYIDQQAKNYTAHYTVKTTELFHVTKDTPRIIEMPEGVGDIKYSLLVASCSSSKVDEENYLNQLKSD